MAIAFEVPETVFFLPISAPGDFCIQSLWLSSAAKCID